MRRIVKRAGLGLAVLAGGCEFIDSQLASEPATQPQTPPPAVAPISTSPAARQPATPAASLPAAKVTPFTPGFDCNDAYWCVGVSPNGDISIGNPGGAGNDMKPTAKNVLVDQANRQPRSFVVKSTPPDLGPQDANVCRAMDSYGNIYGGNIRNPASRTFFRRQTEASTPAVPGIGQLVPGFDCNYSSWCLGVSPNGDVYIGDPNGYEGAMLPTGKNVLTGQANKQPRSFTIKCLPTSTLEDPFICRGSDSFGNVYAGNSRRATNPNFFKLR